MKKTIALVLVVAVLMTVAAMGFAGCDLFKSISLDDAKTTLTNAGYEVLVLTPEEYVEQEDAFSFIFEHELDAYLYASKGDDQIHIFFFNTIEEASANYDMMFMDDLLSGQHNKVVYLGTKQAIKDAGL